MPDPLGTSLTHCFTTVYDTGAFTHEVRPSAMAARDAFPTRQDADGSPQPEPDEALIAGPVRATVICKKWSRWTHADAPPKMCELGKAGEVVWRLDPAQTTILVWITDRRVVFSSGDVAGVLGLKDREVKKLEKLMIGRAALSGQVRYKWMTLAAIGEMDGEHAGKTWIQLIGADTYLNGTRSREVVLAPIQFMVIATRSELSESATQEIVSVFESAFPKRGAVRGEGGLRGAQELNFIAPEAELPDGTKYEMEWNSPPKLSRQGLCPS